MPLRATLCAFFVFLGSLSAPAQQFSADIVQTENNGTRNSGKVHVLNGKVRIEIASFPDGFFLLDGVSAYFVRPSNRIYMEARQSSPLTGLMMPIDPVDPCRQWQEMALRAGSIRQDEAWRCERIKDETIATRAALQYRVTSSVGRELMLGWIDVELKFPLKIELDNGTEISVSNIIDDRQPSELFEIPAGFRRFDPESLIQRIKHSDVWVEDSYR